MSSTIQDIPTTIQDNIKKAMTIKAVIMLTITL